MLAAATPDALRWLAESAYVHNRIAIAFEQAALSTVVAMAAAFSLAWFHHRRALPWGRLQLAIHAAPFVLPVFVVVFGLQAILGRGGWVDAATGVAPLAALGPLGAVVLANAYYNYGMAARLIAVALARRPHRMEEAASLLGASPRASFLRVTLPAIAPALLGAALLAFLFSLGSFGVVLYLGQGEVATLETLLYENLRGAFASEDRAALLAILQLALNVVVLGGYVAAQRRLRLPAEPDRTPPPATLRRRASAWLIVAVPLAPFAAVLTGAFRVRGAWSLEAWRALAQQDHEDHLSGFDLGHAVAMSLQYAAATAFLAVASALLVTHGLSRRRTAEVFFLLPVATSSLVLGFGFLLTFGAGSALDLRGTRIVVVAAHTLLASALVARIVMAALDRHDTRLDEAAALLGASRWRVFTRIHLPLLAPAIAAAAGLAAALSLGDLGASVLLMDDSTASVSAWIHRLGGPGSFNPLWRAQATALSALLLVMSTAVLLATEAPLWRRT